MNNRGGYVHSVRNKLNNDIKRQNTRTYIQTQKMPQSEMNLYYLEKCIAFLQSKNIKIYFVRSPMHKKHKGIFNEKLYQKLLHTRFKDIEFLDFKDYPLPDADFADLNHLNYKGANKFSIWFNEHINTDGFIIQQKP